MRGSLGEIIGADLYRSCGGGSVKKCFWALRHDRSFRYLFFWRILKCRENFLIRRIFSSISKETGIEIPLTVDLAPGALMIHPRNITINSKVVIGKNLTILKGATIGSQLRGKNEGSPTIGNNVYIGINAVVVGRITVGNNVLIAANSYVNFDVPDNSIVIGSPGVIHLGKGADVYIRNKIGD